MIQDNVRINIYKFNCTKNSKTKKKTHENDLIDYQLQSYSVSVPNECCSPKEKLLSVYLALAVKTLLYQIEWSTMWNISYLTGLLCQRKCCCTFLTIICIWRYLFRGMERSIFFRFGISFSKTKTAKDSQFNISKNGGTKLSDKITGTHSYKMASTTLGLLTS